MTWRFEPGEPLAAAFARVAAEEIEIVRKKLRRRGRDPGAAIHAARQSFKRIRALLRLARPTLGEDFSAENRRYRDAGRLLAGSREAIVLAETFDKMAADCSETLSPKDAGLLRAHCIAEVHANGKADIDRRVAQVLAVVDEGEARLSELHWPADSKELFQGLRASQTHLRSWYDKAVGTNSAGALHEWRKRVKDQSAQLRLLRELMPLAYRRMRDQEAKVAELLGLEHDLWMLKRALGAAKVPRKTVPARDALAQEIRTQRHALREQALNSGRKFSSVSPKDFARDLTVSCLGGTGTKLRRPRSKPQRKMRASR